MVAVEHLYPRCATLVVGWVAFHNLHVSVGLFSYGEGRGGVMRLHVSVSRLWECLYVLGTHVRHEHVVRVRLRGHGDVQDAKAIVDIGEHVFDVDAQMTTKPNEGVGCSDPAKHHVGACWEMRHECVIIFTWLYMKMFIYIHTDIDL